MTYQMWLSIRVQLRAPDVHFCNMWKTTRTCINRWPTIVDVFYLFLWVCVCQWPAHIYELCLKFINGIWVGVRVHTLSLTSFPFYIFFSHSTFKNPIHRQSLWRLILFFDASKFQWRFKFPFKSVQCPTVHLS